MVVVLIVGGGIGWVARKARIQLETVAAIRRVGGTVTYAPNWFRTELGADGVFRQIAETGNFPWPEWLIETLGPDLFLRVKYVRLNDYDRSVLGEVGKLDGLEELDLFGPNLIDADLAALRGLKQLRCLDIRGACDSHAHFGQLTNVTGAGLAYLEGLTNLEILQVPDFKITDAEMAALSGLTRLEALSFDPTSLTDRGLAHMSGLKRLKHLQLAGSRVTTAGLRSLAASTRMTNLYLDNTPIDDLAPIRDMISLRTLSVEGCPIDDRGLAPLGEFKGLQYLDISGTKVTDTGFAHLNGLADLVSLSANRTAVTDVGFTCLTGLKSLVRINLIETSTTHKGKQVFKETFPRVIVIY